MKQLCLFVLTSIVIISLHSCSYIPSLSGGKTWYRGEPSWRDPVGAQVAVEAKVTEVNKQSYLTAGIGYSLQGSAYEDNNSSGKVTAHYLIAPLLYYYQHIKGFYAEAGLQPSVLLAARDKYKGGEGPYTYEGSSDYKDQMKSFNLGLPIGAGYRCKNGFGVGIRTIIGITKNHKEGNSRDMLILLRASWVLEEMMKRKKK